jgi:hypothetical protein
MNFIKKLLPALLAVIFLNLATSNLLFFFFDYSKFFLAIITILSLLVALVFFKNPNLNVLIFAICFFSISFTSINYLIYADSSGSTLKVKEINIIFLQPPKIIVKDNKKFSLISKRSDNTFIPMAEFKPGVDYSE